MNRRPATFMIYPSLPLKAMLDGERMWTHCDTSCLSWQAGKACFAENARPCCGPGRYASRALQFLAGLAGHLGPVHCCVQTARRRPLRQIAFAKSCYVAPTQAALAPDGSQICCGSHAIRRNLAIGSIAERGVFASIRSGMSGLSDLSREEDCYGHALTTLHIKQSVETRRTGKLEEMVTGVPPTPGD